MTLASIFAKRIAQGEYMCDKQLMDGTRARARRVELNLSREYVAAAVGVSAQTISNWETGATDPPLAKAALLANALKIELNDLLES